MPRVAIVRADPEIAEISAPPPEESAGGAKSWRREDLLERFGGDGELVNQLVSMFVTEAPALMNGLRAALASEDPTRVEQAAHKLTGCAAHFDAGEALRLVRRIEAVARTGSLREAADLFAALEMAMTTLLGELRVLSEVR